MSGDNLRAPLALVARGLLPPAQLAEAEAVAARYAVGLTPAMAALIDPADPADPIGLQFIPDIRELQTSEAERADPIGDAAHSPCDGLVHRYPDRVLLKLVSVCAVYCRFCFRRESVGPGRAEALSPEALDHALRYIAARAEIWEVILTGGDPLAASTRRLAALSGRLATIAHVQVLRLHTRIPVVAPERIDDATIAALKASGKTVFVAIHANHPRELTPAAVAACGRLADAGICLVSQSVLLRGINDDVATLATLMRAFVAARVKPYYLHHPDLAPGTGHFRLTIEEGRALVGALRGHVSGLCQPTYVLDIPGGYGKVPLGPTEAQTQADGSTLVRDYRGTVHAYAPTRRNKTEF
jgi:lysine 2,3-aminomutase